MHSGMVHENSHHDHSNPLHNNCETHLGGHVVSVLVFLLAATFALIIIDSTCIMYMCVL